MDEFDHLPMTGWYPGHMLKAGRKMREALKLIDLVVELVDARLPLSSRNPAFRRILHGKPAVLLANKADLADEGASRHWQEAFAGAGERVAFLDSRDPGNPSELTGFWKRTVAEEREKRGAVHALNRPVRVMIAGIPNVGKSTLVNRLSAGKKAEVGPKPGVTRHNQWIRLRDDVELLDTPGVLWPKIRDKEHELRLALIGTMKDEYVGTELLAEFLWHELRTNRSRVAWDLYELPECPDDPHDLIRAVAARRGLLRAGGRIDAERAATALLKDFRDGRLGRITLELPGEPLETGHDLDGPPAD